MCCVNTLSRILSYFIQKHESIFLRILRKHVKLLRLLNGLT